MPLSLGVNANYTTLGILSPFVGNRTAPGTAITTLYNIDFIGNPIFQTYKNLYDEIRIIRVGAKITGLDLVGNGGAINAIKIITYWDRHHQARDVWTGNLISLADMINMPGARSHTFTNNSQIKLWTAVRASDLIEKIQYEETDTAPFTLTAAETGWANPQSGRCLSAYSSGAASQFFPALYICCWTPRTNNTGNAIPLNLMVDFYCTVEFRNPKYTAQAASSSAKDGELKTVPMGSYKFTQEELTNAFFKEVAEKDPNLSDEKTGEMEFDADQLEAS